MLQGLFMSILRIPMMYLGRIDDAGGDHVDKGTVECVIADHRVSFGENL